MKIRQHRRHGISVLSLHGHLSGGEDSCALVDRVSALAAQGEREVVLNLSGTKFISSPGLGILIRARSEFLVPGGMLRLCAIKSRDVSVLLYTKTLLLFEVYDTEQEAVQAALASLQEAGATEKRRNTGQKDTGTELSADRD